MTTRTRVAFRLWSRDGAARRLRTRRKEMSDGSDGDPTPQKHRGLKEAWKAGQSGNPAGRPKGSRNKLGEDFIAALYADFQEHGPATIERAREQDPAAYLRIIAGLLPKEVKIEDLRDLTDEQLDG